MAINTICPVVGRFGSDNFYLVHVQLSTQYVTLASNTICPLVISHDQTVYSVPPLSICPYNACEGFVPLLSVEMIGFHYAVPDTEHMTDFPYKQLPVGYDCSASATLIRLDST